MEALVQASFAAGSIVPIATVAIRLHLGAAAEVANVEVVEIAHIVRAHEGKRRLVVKVAPLRWRLPC